MTDRNTHDSTQADRGASGPDASSPDASGPFAAIGGANMKLVMSLVWAWFGVAIALLGATWLASTGPTYLVPIEGYDPRHPITGHYLAFNYRWNVPDREPNSPVFLQSGFDPDAPPTCLCFQDPARGDVDPEVTLVPCSQTATCYTSVPMDVASEGARFYVPEADAAMLDELVRTHAAAIRVRVLPIGRLVPVELFLVETATPEDPDALLPIGTTLDLRTQTLRPWRELR